MNILKRYAASAVPHLITKYDLVPDFQMHLPYLAVSGNNGFQYNNIEEDAIVTVSLYRFNSITVLKCDLKWAQINERLTNAKGITRSANGANNATFEAMNDLIGKIDLDVNALSGEKFALSITKIEDYPRFASPVNGFAPFMNSSTRSNLRYNLLYHLRELKPFLQRLVRVSNPNNRIMVLATDPHVSVRSVAVTLHTILTAIKRIHTKAMGMEQDDSLNGFHLSMESDMDENNGTTSSSASARMSTNHHQTYASYDDAFLLFYRPNRINRESYFYAPRKLRSVPGRPYLSLPNSDGSSAIQNVMVDWVFSGENVHYEKKRRTLAEKLARRPFRAKIQRRRFQMIHDFASFVWEFLKVSWGKEDYLAADTAMSSLIENVYGQEGDLGRFEFTCQLEEDDDDEDWENGDYEDI